ncbi:MAG TPA: hypothetical protein VGO53_16440 [Steroidobacteraceae bacterium]|jgi:hypothetical protein|nr:hypothetical protein [Steroidobacteraceae bacterium]
MTERDTEPYSDEALASATILDTPLQGDAPLNANRLLATIRKLQADRDQWRNLHGHACYMSNERVSFVERERDAKIGDCRELLLNTHKFLLDFEKYHRHGLVDDEARKHLYHRIAKIAAFLEVK